MHNSVKIIIGLLLLCWIPSTALTAEVTYYHTDAHGTPMAMTDSAGKVVWKGDYYPFGEEYLIQETPEKNKRHFTGKEKDEESGLHYFGARYMDEVSGRFVSPDPVTAVDPETSETNTALLENPLRLNRYVYGLNNPYRYIDPDGEFAVESEEYVAFKNEARTQINSASIRGLNLALSIGAIMIEMPVVKGPIRGIYKFPDQKTGGKPYIGQSKNIMNRLKTHERAGRLKPGTETYKPVSGGKTAREIAEHNDIQKITKGKPARHSSAVSNKVDPIGPKRRHLLE